MIGKTGTGASFGGIVDYLLSEKEKLEQGEKLKEPLILASDGIDIGDKESIKESFNDQRKQLPNLGKAVWHTSISFDHDDNVSNDQMKEIAEDLMHELGLENTQYLIVKHHDTKHDHFHILANRVGYDGKAISDSHSKRKTKDRCEKLTKKYGLVQAKDKVNERKADLHKVIKSGIEEGKGFDSIMKDVEKIGYTYRFNQSKAGKINGVSFKDEAKGVTYKASEIDRKFSYTKMIQAISQRQAELELKKLQDQGKQKDLEKAKAKTEKKEPSKGFKQDNKKKDNGKSFGL